MLRLVMLKAARRFYGYTQDELARLIGTTQQYYTQVENGSTKSGPTIKQLSEVLKVKESFLGASGEYVEYPFLLDFYIFTLAEKDLGPLYRDIRDYICSKSDFVDIVFLLDKQQTPQGYPTIYIAIRDDKNTVFLFKRRLRIKDSMKAKKRESKEIEIKTFSKADTFREQLHSLKGVRVFETTKIVSEESCAKIENGSVKREDILTLFPNPEYFIEMFDDHMKFIKPLTMEDAKEYIKKLKLEISQLPAAATTK